ncbi:hypothetical protein ACH47Z_19235 [Streptomyces sp. NPDC020192]|uniref:hypothetical protein n=1 Tax=Streptomyces sp. NPDC020192 TaxID=3365066 RepID=UPI00379DE177
MPLARSILDGLERDRGETSPDAIEARNVLAQVLVTSGEIAAASALVQRNLGICERELDEQHPATQATRDLNARVEQVSRMRGLFGTPESIKRLFDVVDESNGFTGFLQGFRTVLASLTNDAADDQQNPVTREERVFAECLRSLGDGAEATLRAQARLFVTRIMFGDPERARVLAEQAAPVFERELGAQDMETRGLYFFLELFNAGDPGQVWPSLYSILTSDEASLQARALPGQIEMFADKVHSILKDRLPEESPKTSSEREAIPD